MGLLCCGNDDDKTKPLMIPTPPRIAPMLVRRRSVPRPRASKQNIERFYREGRELLRAEQEEQEISGLRATLRQEYGEDVMAYDDDATEIRGPVDFGDMRGYERNGARTVAADSMFRTMHNRRYSFETATDRMGVKAKKSTAVPTPDSEVTEVHLNSYSQHSLERMEDNPPSETPWAADIAAYETYLRRDNAEPNKGSYHSRTVTARATADRSLDRRMDAVPAGSHRERDLDAGGFITAATAVVVEGEEGHRTSRVTRSAKKHHRVALSGARMKEPPKLDGDATRGAKTRGGSGASGNQVMAIPPEELFSRIPNLLKSSTSTFFGSNSSVFGPRVLSSPASDETQLRHRFSQRSLHQGQPSRKQSKSTLFMQQRIDSGSSVYPSPDASECPSLDESVPDVPDTTYRGQHATTMPSRHARRDTDTCIPRTRSVASYKSVEEPANISKFSFPWNGQANPTLTQIHAEIVHEELQPPVKPGQQMESPPPGKKKNQKGPVVPQKRSSSARAFTGILNFVKSGITSGEYSSASVSSEIQSPGNPDSGPVSLTTGSTSSTPPANYSSRNSGTPQSGRTAQQQIDIYSRHNSSSIFRDDDDDRRDLRHQTSSLRREVAMETAESLGRFDHLGDSDQRQPRSLALRKSFTISIAKLREKVSIGGFKTIPKAGRDSGESTNRPAIKPRQSIATMHDVDTQPEASMEHQRAAGRISRKQKVRALRSPAAWEDSEGASWGSGAEVAKLRRSNTTQTMPSRRSSASASAAAAVGDRKRRNTTYNDCVIVPFAADGGDDHHHHEGECIAYGDGNANVNVNVGAGFQQEEYDTERSFWRETRSMAELSTRRASIGTAH